MDRRVAAVRDEAKVPQVATEVAAAVMDDDMMMMMTNQDHKIGQGTREHAGAGLQVAACARLCAGDRTIKPQDPGTFPPNDNRYGHTGSFSHFCCVVITVMGKGCRKDTRSNLRCCVFRDSCAPSNFTRLSCWVADEDNDRHIDATTRQRSESTSTTCALFAAR